MDQNIKRELINSKLDHLDALRNDLEIKLKFIKQASDEVNYNMFINDPFILDYDYLYIQLVQITVIQVCFLSEEKDKKTKKENLFLNILINDIKKYRYDYGNDFLENIDTNEISDLLKDKSFKEKLLVLKDYRNNIYAHYSIYEEELKKFTIGDFIEILEIYIKILNKILNEYNIKRIYRYNKNTSKLHQIFINNNLINR